MNQDELDDLPINGDFKYEMIPLPDPRYPDARGASITIPRSGEIKLMMIEPDDYALIEDRKGNKWCTGTIDGVKHKQRVYI